MVEQSEPEKQPFLPRFGMIWFFIIVTLVAIAIGVIQAADQGRSMAAAIVFSGVFILTILLSSAACFFVAYVFGAIEKTVVQEDRKTKSPFAHDTLPEQIIPPRPSEHV